MAANKVIRTYHIVMNNDDSFDAAAMGGIIDIAIKNTGDTPAQISFTGSPNTTILAVDALLSLGGYDDAVRDDNLKIVFSALVTTRQIEIFGNRIMKEC